MASHNMDSLNIKITSNAQSANNALNTLEKHLTTLATKLSDLGAQSGGLSKFSASVTQLSEAMINFKNSGIGTADFTRLVKNIGQLSNIDHAGIEATAHSLDRMGESMNNIAVLSENASRITEFTSALSKLGNKGVSEAINNLPRLTDAFRELLVTLNETPEIRQDVLSMTQALAEFVSGAKGYVNQSKSMQTASIRVKVSVGTASQALEKFGQVARRVLKTLIVSPFKTFATGAKALASGLQSCVGKLKTFATHSERAEKSASKFAQTIGTLYVKFWLLARVLGKLWSSVKSSFDYLETVNYFTSSFQAVAKKATTTMANAGEESAEAYYKSFTDTATALTRKMTGFDISGGQLTMTKGANLGLDPQTTLTYQTTFAQIASSMGVASDKAVQLSNVLTEIGADLASVKNMEFEDVWQNMASALVGMSRAVDKFGINIRASAMDEKLLELGINKTSKELSQADKALLRTIIILDSSKYAWADLADTLDTPANQIRMLTANLHKLATMFGSLFLPILKKVLPYINALVIALQRLMQTLMQVFGIDLSEMLPKGGAGASDALSDVLDDAEGTDEALEDATDQAKKLKNNLLGIDELNIINDNSSDDDKLDDLGASGLLDQAFLDAIEDYQKAWDDAFKKLENKAQEIADKIVEWAKKVWKPIGEAWDAVGDNVIDKWKYMTGELGKLFKSIASDWAEVWAQDKTEKIFEHIFNSIANIFEFVGNLARQFRIAWDEADRGKHILETVRDIILKVAEHADKMTASWAKWAGELNFAPILQAILDLLTSIKNVADDILGIFDDFQELFLQPAIKYAVEEFFPRLLDICKKLVDDINWGTLREAFADIFRGLEKIFEFLGDTFLDKLDKLETVIADLVNTYMPRLGDAFKKLGDDLKNAKDINDVINALFDFADGRAVDVAEIVNMISKAFNDAIEKVDWKNLGHRIGQFINKFVMNLDAQSLGENVSNIAKAFFETIHGAVEKVDWYGLGKQIGKFLKGIDWYGILKEVWGIVKEVAGGIIEAWAGSFSESPTATKILTAIVGIFAGNKLSKLLTGKGIGQNLLESLFGSNDKMGTENTLFGKIAGSAKDASVSKGLFADANKRVSDSADVSIGKLGAETGLFAGLGDKIGGFLKIFGGVGLILGGAITAIKNFVDQWQEGFNVIDAILTALGIALVAVGAIILGAPALITGVIAGIVFAIGEGIILIHEHWDEIVQWWQEKKEAIGKAFEGIGEKFGEIGETISQKWDEFKTTIGQKWEDLKTGFSTFIGEWQTKISQWASEKWETITDKVEEIRGAIQRKWEEIKENFATHIQEWHTKITEWASTKWEDITNKVEEIRKGIEDKWTEMRENFQTHIEGWREKIELWAQEKWDTVQDKVEEVRGYIERKWGEMQQAFSDHIQYWKDSLIEWAQQKWDDITTTMDKIKTEINDRWELMKKDFDDFKERWKEKIQAWAQEKWDDIITAMQTLRDDIQRKWEDFKADFTAFLQEWQQKIGEWASEKWDTVVETFENLKRDIHEKWENIKTDASEFWGKFKTDLKGFAEKAGESVLQGFEKLKKGVGEIWSNLKKDAQTAFDAIGKKAGEIWDNVKKTVGNVIDKVSDIGSSKTNPSAYDSANSSKLASALKDTATTAKKKLTETVFSNSFLKLIRGYATGGFPEDGLFFANHGELVGQFSNGRTAVANNQQITDGIAQATYQAIMKANSDSNSVEADLLRELIVAVRQGSKVVIDGREIVTAYDNRKARNGYSFA